MRTRLFVTTIALTAIAGLAMAGCGKSTSDAGTPGGGETTSAAPAKTPNGIEALPVDDAYTKGLVTTAAQKSYHFVGNSGNVNFDVFSDGAHSVLKLAEGDADGEIRVIGKDMWAKGEKFFYEDAYGTALGDTLWKLGGDTTWTHMLTTDARFSGINAFLDPRSSFKAQGALSKGEQKDINGIPTLSIKDAGTNGGTLSIATVGEPLVVRFEPNRGGAVDFTYGETIAVAPPTADIVEVPAA